MIMFQYINTQLFLFRLHRKRSHCSNISNSFFSDNCWLSNLTPSNKYQFLFNYELLNCNLYKFHWNLKKILKIKHLDLIWALKFIQTWRSDLSLSVPWECPQSRPHQTSGTDQSGHNGSHQTGQFRGDNKKRNETTDRLSTTNIWIN